MMILYNTLADTSEDDTSTRFKAASFVCELSL